MKKRKIFGIGLPKTGQTSLAHAMYLMDYKVVQYPYTNKQIEKNDFALDLPVTLNYKKLDKKYPNSKFIMTIRDYDSWIKSMKNHYKNFPAKKRYAQQLIFRFRFWKTIYFDKKLMTEKYYSHQKEVENYFKDREKDLLIIDICNGEGYKKLCTFLKRKIPRKPFPKKNIGVYKKSKRKK